VVPSAGWWAALLELQQALPWAARQPERPEASAAALLVALLVRQPVITLVHSTAGPLVALWIASGVENDRVGLTTSLKLKSHGNGLMRGRFDSTGVLPFLTTCVGPRPPA
jgi:hypothetical protein